MAAPRSSSSIATVVLNWNQAALTVTCLEHLARQTRPSSIIVVDNGSTDDSIAVLARSAVPHEVVALESNLGFSGGMNAGLRRAIEMGATYVWLLNNDAFAEPDCLEALARHLDRYPDVWAVGPRLLNPDGSEQHAGGVIDWATCDGGFKPAGELAACSASGSWLAGTAILLRAEGFLRVGFLDHAFFAYWEDIDLSLRLTSAGGRLAALPEARVVHDAGSSSGGTFSPVVHFLSTRNTWRVVHQHAPPSWRADLLRRYCAVMLRRAGTLEAHGRHAAAVATVQGVGAALTGRFGPPPATCGRGRIARAVLRHPWRLASILDRRDRAPVAPGAAR